MSITWRSVGNYLELHYSEEVQVMERKLCHCFKDRGFQSSGLPYPMCVSLFFLVGISMGYWETIVNELKVDSS